MGCVTALPRIAGGLPNNPADHLKGTCSSSPRCLEQKAAWQLPRKMGQIQVGKCSQKLQNDARSASCVFKKKDKLFYTWKKKQCLPNLCGQETGLGCKDRVQSLPCPETSGLKEHPNTPTPLAGLREDTSGDLGRWLRGSLRNRVQSPHEEPRMAEHTCAEEAKTGGPPRLTAFQIQ